MSYLYFFIVGAAGAFAKDILKDGAITMPYFHKNKLYLGFIGSAILGGMVAMVVDHSYLIAFLSGYVGFSIVENMLPKKILSNSS